MKKESVPVLLACIAVAYEAWALVDKREGDTISEIIWTAAAERPLVPFALGLLMGHFFWQRVDSRPPARAS